MKTYKIILLFTFIFLMTASLHAQDESGKNTQDETEKQKGYDPTNWFTGGSVSLGYSGGYYSSFIAGLHPHYGYTLAKWLDVAAVANFEYQTQKVSGSYKVRSTTYGLGAFMRIYPVHFLFVQAQPEYNFIAQKVTPYVSSSPPYKINVHAPSFLVGGGYTTSRSDKNSFTYLSILLDVIKDINSPYVDGDGSIMPIIRAGVNIGLNRSKRR
ncbi:MAG TPA: hypothetical protein VMY77_16810 [Chitinophagaceae bacterium]|nr:hypothetical protein [Chitinophagaceae bacterium]